MRIIHFSDTHYPASFPAKLFPPDKRLIGYLNSRIIRGGRSYDQDSVRRVVDYVVNSKPDLAVFTGDAVSTGDPAEFEEAVRIFTPLVESSIPLIYVPGNHDKYVKDASCRAALEKFYSFLWRGTRTLSDGEPFTVSCGNADFSVLDCASPCAWVLSSGTMSKKSLKYLESEALRCERAGKRLVLVNHFPVLKNGRLLGKRHGLFGFAGRAADVIKSNHVLSLCGHVHKGYELFNGSEVSEICAGSAAKYGTFVEISCPERGETLSYRRISL